MSRQDADDETDSTPEEGEQSVDAEGAETSPAESEGTAAQSGDSPGEQSLEEIATEPNEDPESALEEIVEGASTESAAEPEAVDVEEDLRAQIAELEPTETAGLVAALRQEVTKLEEELAEERERAEDLESRLARKQADFQNYKERQQREQERVREQATQDVLERFVEIRDNLVRALEQDEDADIRSGVESTLSLFDDKLQKEGVSVIDPAEGEKPDPRRHEVLVNVASDLPSGTICDTHRAGYEMGESVIRPAQVAVSDGSLRDEEGDAAEDTAASETDGATDADDE